MSAGARASLSRAASGLPGGERLLEQVLQIARESLSNSIHEGFVFILVAVSFSIIAALIMRNVRLDLEASSAETAVPGMKQRETATLKEPLPHVADRAAASASPYKREVESVRMDPAGWGIKDGPYVGSPSNRHSRHSVTHS